MKKLTLENWNELQIYIEKADYKEYNSNTMTMLMWNSMYEVMFQTFEHYAIAYTCIPRRKPVWLMPYCTIDYREEAIAKIKEISEQIQIPFEIHSMTLEFKQWLQDTYSNQFLAWECTSAQDYVYDYHQQLALTGKKMQKRRNHHNTFVKEYENRFYYKSIEKEDIPHVYEFLAYWQSRKEKDESIDAEDIGIHTLLEHMDTLPIIGGCIYIDGKLEAFTIASYLSSDTIQIHVEKANRNIRGLYIAILKNLLANLAKPVVYINREEDMGISALRKAKSDMHPIIKIRKFGSSYEPIHIQKADASVVEEVKQLWKTSFPDETPKSTAFYFNYLYNEQDCYVLKSQDELICMLQMRKMQIMIRGNIEDVSFVVGVACAKEYERCGYMKQLLTYALNVVSKTEKFTLLQAYNWDIYKPFGFKECYTHKKTLLDVGAYLPSENNYESCDDPVLLLSLYDAYTQDKDGYRIRDLAYYNSYFIPYHRQWNHTILVYRQDKQALGYLVVEENEQDVCIVECISTSQKALDAMMGALSIYSKPISVVSSLEDSLHGFATKETCMMVKEHSTETTFPNENLFISEEL